MTLSKLASLRVPMITAAALVAACSSSTLTSPRHDSGTDTPVPSKPDSGHDGPAPMDAAGDSQVTSHDSGSDASGVGGCSGHVLSPAEVPASHRAIAMGCQWSVYTVPYDGGTCTSNADCPATFNFGSTSCLQGHCSPDQCLTDADCGANEVCACNTHVQAPTLYRNLCVPANCHVDSDCGPGGYCSPSFVSCGYLAGYFCHTAKDTCYDYDTCGCGQVCQYTPTVGAFTCMAAVPCSG